MLLFAFKAGDTDIFEWDKVTDELLKIEFDKRNEHNEEIVAIDTHPGRKYIVSAGKDYLVKIWN